MKRSQRRRCKSFQVFYWQPALLSHTPTAPAPKTKSFPMNSWMAHSWEMKMHSAMHFRSHNPRHGNPELLKPYGKSPLWKSPLWKSPSAFPLVEWESSRRGNATSPTVIAPVRGGHVRSTAGSVRHSCTIYFTVGCQRGMLPPRGEGKANCQGRK